MPLMIFFVFTDKQRKCQDKALLQQALINKKMQRESHIELTQYWAIQQQVEDSRDADLKRGHKGAFNITIPESKLGPASMQIFQVHPLCDGQGLCVLHRPAEQNPVEGK